MKPQGRMPAGLTNSGSQNFSCIASLLFRSRIISNLYLSLFLDFTLVILILSKAELPHGADDAARLYQRLPALLGDYQYRFHPNAP